MLAVDGLEDALSAESEKSYLFAGGQERAARLPRSKWRKNQSACEMGKKNGNAQAHGNDNRPPKQVNKFLSTSPQGELGCRLAILCLK